MCVFDERRYGMFVTGISCFCSWGRMSWLEGQFLSLITSLLYMLLSSVLWMNCH